MKELSANELRIGNLVLAEVGLPSLELHIIKSADIPEIEKGTVKVYGVSVTPELLVKYGFESVHHRIGVRASFKLTRINAIRINMSYSRNFYYGKKFINNIHQLQNLVFANTGTELILSNQPVHV